MNDIFGLLGISKIVNAAGPVTPHSGSPIDSDIAMAMATVAQCCVDIAELQGRASEIITECTGAEAGIVTSGATAGLLLGAAACVTGYDPIKMGRLPDTSGMKNEFLVSHSHRNSYDHGVRAAGVRLVEVGMADRLVGVGIRDTELWEIERAINGQTAGILYLARPDSRPALAAVVEVARNANIPVLVDAAAELPPASNLRRFIADGADLVVFSGGKALRGPSGSGILCGRRPLVGSALLQQLDLDFIYDMWAPPPQLIDKNDLIGVPRHGIGRSCKVGKEQIVGLLMALLRFVATADQARCETAMATADALIRALGNVQSLNARLSSDSDGRRVPLVEVSVASLNCALNAEKLVAALRASTPSIRVDASRAPVGIITLVPTCLAEGDVDLIANAFKRALQGIGREEASRALHPAAPRSPSIS